MHKQTGLVVYIRLISLTFIPSEGEVPFKLNTYISFHEACEKNYPAFDASYSLEPNMLWVNVSERAVNYNSEKPILQIAERRH